MIAQQELQQGILFYRALGETQGLAEITQTFLHILEKLEQFAEGSAKRCKDKNLEEAFRLLLGVSKGLWELDPNHLLPLARCVLACQMETTGASSSFHRLEKMVAKLSEGHGALISEQVDELMSSLVEDKEVLSPRDLQTICMFLEESMLGRCYWRKNLMPLLRGVSTTFDLLSQDQVVRNDRWQYLTVKMCLLLFKLMPEAISPLVWKESEKSGILQNILGSLVRVIVEKEARKDTRLLAGTVLSMLVNTAPEPQSGAASVLGLYHLLSPDSVVQKQDPGAASHKGGLRLGVLRISPCAWSPDGLETVALTRGLLTCCKKEILSCQLEVTLPKTCLLLDVLFPAVLVLMEEQKDHHYYCFQVFTLWLQRVRESLDEIWKVKENCLLADNSRLLQRLTHFLWNNAESLVEGLSDFVHSSFRLLLEIYSLECDHFKNPERPLYEQFLQRVVDMPWQSRARYFPLSAVLPYLGPAKVLDSYKDLPQHLLNCLSTNHLCPPASDLYKTLLQLQRQVWTEGQRPVPEEELAQKWARGWLSTVSAALTSSIPLLQSNASNYLLVSSLRVFPASYALLAEGFRGGGSAQLRAWVTVLNAQKTITGALPTDGESLNRLSACLFSQEENIRLAALGLLCGSPRTNQALSETEGRLLKEFLVLNLNCDSSAFRQLLQATVRKALVRLRDSSLATFRRQGQDKKEGWPGGGPERSLAPAVGFVEWLQQLCFSSLMSGANYQRRKTALLLLAAILETCTDTWSPERKKGQPPRNMAALLSWARSRGCWDFFSRSNMLSLLSCLQDGTNEIRELASELLVCYFPPAFPESLAVALFARAEEAMSSPRVQEAEAGAVLMKTILQKSDNGLLKQILPEGETELPVEYRCLCFLLSMLNVHHAKACHDMLEAARTSPLHGVIGALRRCLCEVPEVMASMLKRDQAQRWRDFLGRLVNSVRDISGFLLGVLQSKQASRSDRQAAAPSFADMGNAIGSLIRLGRGSEDHDPEDWVLLSEEHGLILTCCWVSVKEIGLLLGGLMEKILPLAPPAGCEPFLPLQVVKTAGEVFQEILLRCRHWGAVEGCSIGFTKFCATLLSHAEPELQDIPRTMLGQGLALLCSPRSSSITRRAAGFPMLFLCIVVGEDPTKPRPLLANCIQTLLCLANTPILQDWDQTVDLPQVSAIHVLQTLVRGSGLGTALHQYITSMVILFLKALSSPNWAMRNAGIQLFGALTVRLLGQKQSQDDSHGRDGMSSEALFSHYPRLKDILLGELVLAEGVSGEPQRGKFHLYPSLYATLSFLAKLQPTTESLNSSSICFVEPLIQIAGNPIYAVRVMAARALVPLVSATEHGNILLRLASGLAESAEVVSHNALHGCLLQIQFILAHALNVNSLSPDVLLSVARQVEEGIWLLTPLQKCPLIRWAYLQVICLLIGSCSPSFAQRVWKVVNSELDHLHAVEKPGLSQIQVGAATFRQLAAHFLCSEAARLGSPERVGELCSLLQRGPIDVQESILTWLIEKERGKDLDFSKALLEKLGKVLRGRTDHLFLKLYLQAFVEVYSCPSAHNVLVSLKPPEYTKCKDVFLSVTESNTVSPGLLCHALCAFSLLLTLDFEDHPSLERWCVTLERCSDPLSPEALRMAATKSLKLAGVALVQKAQESPDRPLQAITVRLIDVALCLLQDEDQEVRHEVSTFASLLVQPVSGDPVQGCCDLLQSNKGMVSLLHLLLEKFWDCPETFASLVHHLPTTDLSSALTELEAKGAFGLYPEDEPNIYAEPVVLSQMILPFLHQLLDRAPTSLKLWESVQSWLQATGPGVLVGLQHSIDWWSQDGRTSLHLKALACPKVCLAVITLLVKAALVTHMLEILEEGKHPPVKEINFSSQDLRGTTLSVQKLLAHHGMVSMVNVKVEQLHQE
ncbi:thyroid adenoma-associated protein homolog isoform X2 [Hemicordylus capensis]|uniref:thyroid adenoma-associated protein homolog isoform X2 n=1 Tax=Hemicordylus capensis TaxID=884348 RepID=UPI002302207C|nr:thyroid adenoma-associated protein homolog isoform X2 [Hemicordylus capensis]